MFLYVENTRSNFNKLNIVASFDINAYVMFQVYKLWSTAQCPVQALLKNLALGYVKCE